MPGEASKREVTCDTAEERAAIIAEGCGVSRKEAERLTAMQYGAKSWVQLMEGLKND